MIQLLNLEPKYLTVLPDLQRELSMARVNKMAGDWNPDLVGVIEAAELKVAGGRTIIHVIDGWHRTRAAAAWAAATDEVVTLPVVVYQGLNRAKVAQLFLARNNLSKPVSAYYTHTVGLKAHDPLARLIQDVFDDSKFEISKASSAYEVACIAAITAQTRMHVERNNEEVATAFLELTLQLIETAWPNADADRVNNHIVRGLLELFSREGGDIMAYRDTYDKTLEVLSLKQPDEWRQIARKAKEDEPFSTGSEYRYLATEWEKRIF